MAVNCGVSFGICAARVTKVDGEGNVVDEDGNSYATTKLTSVTLRPNIESGNTFSLRNGCGCSIARFKANDVFNWFEFTFTGGALEPEMEALMLGSPTIVDGSDVVGLAFASALECDEDEPAVGLEFWTQHVVGSGPDGQYPRIHWVFPKSVWQLSDREAAENIMTPALTGFSRTNQLWGQGPYGDGPPDGQDIPEGAYWKTADALPESNCASATVEPSS